MEVISVECYVVWSGPDCQRSFTLRPIQEHFVELEYIGHPDSLVAESRAKDMRLKYITRRKQHSNLHLIAVDKHPNRSHHKTKAHITPVCSKPKKCV